MNLSESHKKRLNELAGLSNIPTDIPLSALEANSTMLNDRFNIKLSNYPFWSLNIAPKRNPFGLFSFVVHERDNESYSCFMYKTTYYTNPVVSKDFKKESTLSDILKYIEEVLTTIKTEL